MKEINYKNKCPDMLVCFKYLNKLYIERGSFSSNTNERFVRSHCKNGCDKCPLLLDNCSDVIDFQLYKDHKCLFDYMTSNISNSRFIDTNNYCQSVKDIVALLNDNINCFIEYKKKCSMCGSIAVVSKDNKPWCGFC